MDNSNSLGPLNLDQNLNSSSQDNINDLFLEMASQIDSANQNIKVLNKQLNSLVARVNALTTIITDNFVSVDHFMDELEKQEKEMEREMEENLQNQIDLKEFKSLVEQLVEEIPEA